MPSAVRYIAPPNVSPEAVMQMASDAGCDKVFPLLRRGVHHGWIGETRRPALAGLTENRASWAAAEAVFLPQMIAAELGHHVDSLVLSAQLMESVVDGVACEELFDQHSYVDRYGARFELLAGVYDEGDEQAIGTVEFDVLDGGEPTDELVWVKASWLSFEDDDVSLRFRFSHGHDLYEPVAVDYTRQQLAGALCDALFPESSVLTGSSMLLESLGEILAVPELAFVERIVYFNAPNGGAQFHHDVERGHLGVVFAQLTGRTGWLAVPKLALVDEIQTFLARTDSASLLKLALPKLTHRKKLLSIASERARLIDWMDDADNAPLEALLNRMPEFTQQLVEAGFACIVQPGDVLLLSQHEIDRCAWHSVFCLDDHAGQALSFAVREAAPRETPAKES